MSASEEFELDPTFTAESAGAEFLKNPAESSVAETPDRRRRGLARKLKLVGQQLVAWDLAANSILPGVESALQQRGSGPQEDEKTELVDPAIAKNEDDLRYLRTIFGEKSVSRVAPDAQYYANKNYYDIQRTQIYRGEQEAKTFSPEVGKDFGLSGPELQEVFVDSYPENMVDANVNVIVLEPGQAAPQDAWPSSGEKGHVLGGSAREAYGSRNYVYQDNIRAALETHGHELGHAIGWTGNVDRPVQAKIALWRMVTERVLRGKNRFWSGYLEDVTFQENARTEEIVSEYWGEICGQFFQNPSMLKQKYPEDFTLVRDWVKLQDPVFNPFTAARVREQILSSATLTKISHDDTP